MDRFLTLCVSGAVTGAVYSLVASGLTLTYSATGIFNFAFGGVAFSAAYLYYELNTALHWHMAFAGAVVILVFAPLLGLGLDVAIFRPLARATESAKIMAAVGLLISLPALTEWVTDGAIDAFHIHAARSSTVLEVGFPSGLGPVPARNWQLPFGIPLNSNELAVFAAAALCAGALWLLLRRTSLGLAMRAVVDRPDLARLRGVDPAVTSRSAWMIGTLLAALAGVVGAPVLGSIATGPFLSVTLVAAAAVVIGRFRSVPLAFAGGLAIGVAQNLVTGYATFASNITGFNESVPTLILLGALVVLARSRRRRAGSVSDELPPPSRSASVARWRFAAPWFLAAGFLVVYVTILSDTFWAGVMAQGLALSLVLLSFVVVTGLGGMVSLAQATFVTAAGLTTGLLYQQYHVPFFGAAAAGVVVAVALGLVVALPALRLGGLPLALATLALALLGDSVLFQWNYLRNMQAGWVIPRLHLGPLDLASNRTMAVALLGLVGLVILLISNLRRSAWGRSIAAVRSSEVAAATSGISPLRVKLALFALSAAIAAVGGIAYASFQTSISNSTAPAASGLLWLATVVLFGVRRPGAAALAGIFAAATPVIIQSGFHWWSWVPTFLSWNGTRSSEIPLVVFGLGAVALARHPEGVVGMAAELRSALGYFLRSVLSPTPGAAPAPGSPPSVSAAPAPGSPPTLPATGSIALAVNQLVAGYGELEVLHGIDLSLRYGCITALFGANGGGKSTLVATLGGLVPATSGTLILEERDFTSMPAHRRAEQGLLVAPESRGIFPGLTVEENLQLRLGSVQRQEVFDRFPELGRRRRLTAGSLSGGEQQMLTLAPLLARPPRVLVVDEPTLGLAPLVIETILSLFRELRDQGAAVLLVEEKVRDVLGIADQVAFLELGRIRWAGDRSEVAAQELVAAYLGAGLEPEIGER